MIPKEAEFVFTTKESLPVKIINLSYFKEALLLEMSCNKNKVIVSVIYRSLNIHYPPPYQRLTWD